MKTKRPITMDQVKFVANWAAVSELAHAADLALGSGSEAVKAFGAVLCSRVYLIDKGEADSHMDTPKELAPFVQLGEWSNSQLDEEARKAGNL